MTDQPGVASSAPKPDRRLRALVTRPDEDAAEIAAALAHRGIDPVLAPLMTVVHLTRDVAADVEEAQALLFTSRNGVRAFCALTPRRDRPVYAVGDSTASLAREAGFTTVESAGGNSSDLARLVAEKLTPEGGPLFHAAGETVAGDLSAILESHGFTTIRKALYQAVPIDALPPLAVSGLSEGSLDLVLFFSPRTARVFHELVTAAGLSDACGRMTALCLSGAVADVMPSDTWKEVRVAAEPTSTALLEAIDPAVSAAAQTVQKTQGVERKPETEENHHYNQMESVRDDTTRTSLRRPAEGPQENSAMTKPTSKPPEETAAAAAAAATAAAASVPADRSGARSGPSTLVVLFGLLLVGLVAAVATFPAWRHVLPPSVQAHLGSGSAGVAQEIDDARQATATLAAALAESQAATRSLTATVAAFDARLAELERRQAAGAVELDALKKRPVAGPGTGSAADPAQAAKLTELSRTLAEAAEREAADEKQRAENAAKMTSLVAAMEGRIAGLESRLQAARQAATASGKSDSLGLAAGQLRDALSRSNGFEAELATLRRLGGDAPRIADVLNPIAGYAAAGVPTRTTLLGQVPAVVERAFEAGRAPQQAGWVDRTVDKLRGFVTVRRVDGKGGGIDAVLARAEIAAGKGDLAAVEKEIAALDGAAAKAVEPWLSSVRARLALEEAGRALSRVVLGGLAGGD